MRGHESRQPDDEFDKLVHDLSDVGDALLFHEQGSYGEVSVNEDMKRMRDAFEDRIKYSPGLTSHEELSETDYSYIIFMMNKTEVPRLPELAPGNTLCVGEGAFTAYPTEKGTAYENVAEHERIQGEFVRFLVFPMPSYETMFTGEMDEQPWNFEIGVELRKPVLEDALGSRPLPYEEMFVSIADPTVNFSVRLDSIEGGTV